MLATALALATWLAGWWGVPLVAAAWGLMSRRRTDAAREAALAAILAWAILLAAQAARGPLGDLAARLGSAMRAPAPILMLVTVLFAALLAWSAATVARSIALAAFRAE